MCELLQPIATTTRVLLIAHRYEERKPTNTGHLAVTCLRHARRCLRGRHGFPDDPVTWEPSTVPLLLFPSRDAVRLDTWLAAQPEGRSLAVTLIVPDGTWRQAKRMQRRVPGLAAVQAVCLPPSYSPSYRLRRAFGANRLATLEAIAHALGILEGPEPEDQVMHVFRTAVDRALWCNGRLAAANVTGGVPTGARRHGPPLHPRES